MSAPADRTDGERPLAGARIAIVGCGAIGGALAFDLVRAGAALTLASRSAARCEELAAALGSGVRIADTAPEAVRAAELTLLTVGDGALSGVARELGAAAAESGPAAMLHTNGSAGLELLAPFEQAGWAVGKLHPLVAVPPGAWRGERFRGAWVATRSNAAGATWVERVLAALGARSLPLSDDPRASVALHAAAALLSGGVVALWSAALDAARTAGEDPSLTAEAFASLAAGNLENARAIGARDALSGPIGRGSVELVRRQLDALAAVPDAAQAYRVLGRRMLALAVERGSVSDAQRDELARLLA